VQFDTPLLDALREQGAAGRPLRGLAPLLAKRELAVMVCARVASGVAPWRLVLMAIPPMAFPWDASSASSAGPRVERIAGRP
jgi:hypothetical protein